jgi:hypothetical protein
MPVLNVKPEKPNAFVCSGVPVPVSPHERPPPLITPVCEATAPQKQTAMISESDGAVTLVVNVRVVAVTADATGVPRLVGVPIAIAAYCRPVSLPALKKKSEAPGWACRPCATFRRLSRSVYAARSSVISAAE